MASTVVAMFDDLQLANDAVKELVDNGFSRDSISFLAGDRTSGSGQAIEVTDTETSAAAEGAGVGAGIGAVLGGLGGLLVGLGALAIPGIGPVIAAGPLAAALTTLAGAGAGAVAGGVTGGLMGALVDMGVPEETAQYYAEGIRRGAHLVTINVEDYLVDQAVGILNRHNPVDMNQRVNDWRQTGWTGFDEASGAGLTSAGMTGSTMADMEAASARRDWPASGDQPIEANRAFQEGMDDVNRVDRPGATLYGADESVRTTDRSSDFDDFNVYDDRFRRHFQTSTYSGTSDYSMYQPAYRYGYNLARDERYRDYKWEDLEPEARSYWDERNPGTWERFKDSVRHAWEEVKDALD